MVHNLECTILECSSDLLGRTPCGIAVVFKVIMFAKSNLNGVACTYSGEDACMPGSKECCAENDAVYAYLLANTPPGTIAWNFDKILDCMVASALDFGYCCLTGSI